MAGLIARLAQAVISVAFAQYAVYLIAMRRIVVDASGWQTPIDFIEGLKVAIGAPEWHGNSPDAFLDTMIHANDINDAKPPYVVEIVNTSDLPAEVIDYVDLVSSVIRDAGGRGVGVSIDRMPPS